MSAIRFDEVSKQFPPSAGSSEQGSTYAVRGLSFQVERGELVAVVGKTGCGKSTMFNLLIGLTAPSSGAVSVLGRDPFGDFARLAGKVGVVFQGDRLLPWRSALSNVEYGLELLKARGADRTQVARHWLCKLGLEAHMGKYPHALSGGMRQRVSIARAFATDPEILLCDEPFSALDEINAVLLRNELRRLVKESNKTGMLVTHSIREAMDVGDRILVLRAPGHVVADFRVADMLASAGEDSLKRQILDAMGQDVAALERDAAVAAARAKAVGSAA